MKKHVIAGLICTMTLYCGQSFIVPKKDKEKKESKSQLKERACQSMYAVLNSFSGMMGFMATTQKTILTAIADFIGSEKHNYIDSASEQELKNLCAQLDALDTECKALEQRLQALVPLVAKK